MQQTEQKTNVITTNNSKPSDDKKEGVFNQQPEDSMYKATLIAYLHS